MAKFMFLLMNHTHKHTPYLLTYIILPLSSMNSTLLPYTKLSASMESLGNDENNSSFINIYEISEHVGDEIKQVQGPVHHYQAPPRATDDNDVKGTIQEMKREIDSKIESVVDLVSSRNEEVMRQITLMCENFDSLCGMLVKQGCDASTSTDEVKEQPTLVANTGIEAPSEEKDKGKRVLLPVLVYSDGMIHLENESQGLMEDSRVIMETDLYNETNMGLYSMGQQIGYEKLRVSVGGVSPSVELNQNSVDSVTGTSSLAGLDSLMWMIYLRCFDFYVVYYLLYILPCYL